MIRTIYQEANPDDQLPEPDDFRQVILSYDESPFVIFDRYLVRDDLGQLIAWMALAYTRPEREDYDNKKHATYIQVYVKPSYRQKGLGKQLLKYIVNQAIPPEITVLESGTNLADGKAFANHIGAKSALEEYYVRLKFVDVDWNLIENWIQEGQQRNPDTHLIKVIGLFSDDEAELARFAEFESAVRRDMPSGEFSGMLQMITPDQLRQEHANETKRGMTSVYFISQESDGRFSGFTRINYLPSLPAEVSQRVTGVLRQDRGRGLGKWLKAHMLRYIRDTYPDSDYIQTSYANYNAPMKAINERLGFKPYKEQIFYRLTVEDAKKYLGD
ncbi:MAG: GNAT family N-acetyltransferase [Chloroflexota bacterium]